MWSRYNSPLNGKGTGKTAHFVQECLNWGGDQKIWPMILKLLFILTLILENIPYNIYYYYYWLCGLGCNLFKHVIFWLINQSVKIFFYKSLQKYFLLLWTTFCMEIRYRPLFDECWELFKLCFFPLQYSICNSDFEHKSQFCGKHLPGGWVDFCSGFWTLPRTGIITHAHFLSLPFTLSFSLSVSSNPFPLASALHSYSLVPSAEFSLHSLFYSCFPLTDVLNGYSPQAVILTELYWNGKAFLFSHEKL